MTLIWVTKECICRHAQRHWNKNSKSSKLLTVQNLRWRFCWLIFSLSKPLYMLTLLRPFLPGLENCCVDTWPAQILLVPNRWVLISCLTLVTVLIWEPPKFSGMARKGLHCPESPDMMAVPIICKSSYCLRTERWEGSFGFDQHLRLLRGHTVYSACEEPIYLALEPNSSALGHKFGSVHGLVNSLDQSELRMCQLRMVLYW